MAADGPPAPAAALLGVRALGVDAPGTPTVLSVSAGLDALY